MRKLHRNGFVLGMLFLSLPVVAGSTDLLLLLPGFPGTTSQAQPYVDKMIRYLEKEMGWENKSMKGVFVPDGAKAKRTLQEVKPGIALVGPSVYAEHVSEMNMTVIASVTANGHGEQKYYVVVKKGGPKTLSALSGTVTGVEVYNQKYVYNVILDKKLSLGAISMVPNKRPLRALRDVASGKVTAAIISEDVKSHMDQLAFADGLEILYVSIPVPAPAVVVLNDGKKHATAIKKSLSTLCDTTNGKALCKSLTITSIEPATDKDYRKFLKRYNR